MDQAETLRARLQNYAKPHAKTIAVVSGKGGVGKSNFSLNFAIKLAKKARKILIFDLDIGMGNIEILMGRSAPCSIADYFIKGMSLSDLIVGTDTGIDYISGGSGLSHIVSLNENSATRFMNDLDSILLNYDYVIFDMGAGMTEVNVSILLSVHDVIVITAAEPTAMMDAYAAIKILHLAGKNSPFKLVVNRVSSKKEGEETLNRLEKVILQFLGKHSIKLGMIPDDSSVTQAVKRQIPFSVLHPRGPASRALDRVLERFEANMESDIEKKEEQGFSARFKRLLFQRRGRNGKG
ncbi:MinD/ParA family protein [Bacillus massilinigeriensis]|uniref:MinD/ParA family protein n=1 Tax=Bacillus mediterraneensis TaxID=1805474 RepID=UPI0008F8777A|nr:MinD/ParA family protein [Bacillus mediterraneensis]